MRPSTLRQMRSQTANESSTWQIKIPLVDSPRGIKPCHATLSVPKWSNLQVSAYIGGSLCRSRSYRDQNQKDKNQQKPGRDTEAKYKRLLQLWSKNQKLVYYHRLCCYIANTKFKYKMDVAWYRRGGCQRSLDFSKAASFRPNCQVSQGSSTRPASSATSWRLPWHVSQWNVAASCDFDLTPGNLRPQDSTTDLSQNIIRANVTWSSKSMEESYLHQVELYNALYNLCPCTESILAELVLFFDWTSLRCWHRHRWQRKCYLCRFLGFHSHHTASQRQRRLLPLAKHSTIRLLSKVLLVLPVLPVLLVLPSILPSRVAIGPLGVPRAHLALSTDESKDLPVLESHPTIDIHLLRCQLQVLLPPHLAHLSPFLFAFSW